MKIEITQLDDQHYYVEVTRILLKQTIVCHNLGQALKQAKVYATNKE